MKRCPCPCRRPVPSGRRYAAKGCNLRVIRPERRRALGAQGGRTRSIGFELRLLEELRGLDFRVAVLTAFHRGKRWAYRQRERAAP